MTTPPAAPGSRIRAELSHPIIDSDGHWMEPFPVLSDYVRKVGGRSAEEAFCFMAQFLRDRWYSMAPEQRRAQRRMRPPWWVFPAKTADRATAMLPRMMMQRLDEFGIDFAVVIGSLLPLWGRIPDEQLRRTVVRATNIMHAEAFQSLSARLTPAAFVAMNTPEEAIEEAAFAVEELGLKVAVINGGVWRPIQVASADRIDPALLPQYVDVLAIDSAYDYDPAWAAFADLGLSPMSHNSSMGLPDRSSPTNFVYNHLGHFAQAGHAFARALFLGGVTRRFPTLRFAFLEGGVGWARNLCADLTGHWATRNDGALAANLRPTNLDVPLLTAMLREHGGPWYTRLSDEVLAAHLDPQFPGRDVASLTAQEQELDDFAASRFTSRAEVANAFASNFYFGCEPDDVMTCLAFDERLGPKLKPLFGSDLSHFDVTDMAEVVEEAYRLVDGGVLSPEDFRELTFANAVELHASANPAFFEGTVVERAVRAELSRTGRTGDARSQEARPPEAGNAEPTELVLDYSGEEDVGEGGP